MTPFNLCRTAALCCALTWFPVCRADTLLDDLSVGQAAGPAATGAMVFGSRALPGASSLVGCAVLWLRGRAIAGRVRTEADEASDVR